MGKFTQKDLEINGVEKQRVQYFRTSLNAGIYYGGIYKRLVDAYGGKEVVEKLKEEIIKNLYNYKINGLNIEKWLAVPGIYRWTIKQDSKTYIYIGRSNSLVRRAAQHLLEIFYAALITQNVEKQIDVNGAEARKAYNADGPKVEIGEKGDPTKYDVTAAMIKSLNFAEVLKRVDFEILSYIVPSTGVEIAGTENFRSVYGYLYNTPIYYNPEYAGKTFYRTIIKKLENSTSTKGKRLNRNNIFSRTRRDNREYITENYGDPETTIGELVRIARNEYGRKNLNYRGSNTSGRSEIIVSELEDLFLKGVRNKDKETDEVLYFNKQSVGSKAPKKDYADFLVEETYRQLTFKVSNFNKRIGVAVGKTFLNSIKGISDFKMTVFREVNYSDPAKKDPSLYLNLGKYAGAKTADTKDTLKTAELMRIGIEAAMEAGEEEASKIGVTIEDFHAPFLILSCIYAFSNKKNIFKQFEDAQKREKTFKVSAKLDKQGPIAFFDSEVLNLEINFVNKKGEKK